MAAPLSSLDGAFYLGADDFFRTHTGVALTYDDVTLATLYSEILPRDTNLETVLHDRLHLRLPIISADMDTVRISSPDSKPRPACWVSTPRAR